jgi:SAM-dependent methyltransferase
LSVRLTMMKSTCFAVICFVFTGCSTLFRPYPCGPVLDEEGVQIFKKQSDFLGLQAGTVFADIGASSGYYDAAMAVFVDSVTFYLNDIDHHCLNQKNLDKVLKHFSKIRGQSLEANNTFHYVIGTPTRTKLPHNTFDVIFSNATMHVIEHPDSILVDLYKNLKADGSLFIRDEFVFDGVPRNCPSRKCGHQLLQYKPFIELMSRHGFFLTGETLEFGYPMYKFSKVARL